MVTHELKTQPQFWQALVNGSRPFEVRRNDRKFSVGDMLILREWTPEHGYISAACEGEIRQVSYVLRHEDFPQGVPVGFVVLGFGIMQESDDV
jgi:hypothetical protein